MAIERWYDDERGRRWVFDGLHPYDGSPVYRLETGEEYTARNWKAIADAEVAGQFDDDPYLAYIRETGKCPTCDGPATPHNNHNSPDACDLGHCVKETTR